MAAGEINGGRVSIELDGREFWLEPSLEACVEISGIAGGMSAAVQRCSQLDFATICQVIGAGLRIDGKAPSPRVRQNDLPKSIYNAGVFAMSAKAIDFIHIVANGGRALDMESEEEGGEEDSPLSPSQTITEPSLAELPAG